MAIERAPEIERLVEQSRQAFLTGDVETLTRLTSRDASAVLVGSDATEVARGHEAIVASFEAETAAVAERAIELVPGETTAYRDGDVGWVMTFSAFRLPDGTEVPSRSLNVLHREDGEWRFVQSLFAVAVPNEMLESGSALARAYAGAAG